MPVNRTLFGPGTLTLDPDGLLEDATPGPMDISCQVSSGGVQHEYEDTQDAQTMLGGCETPGVTQRKDSLTFDTLADLTASGLYPFLLANDLLECDFTYTPNSADGHTWAGTVQLRLPDSVTADEYGQPLAGTVTWPGIGQFAYTPGG